MGPKELLIQTALEIIGQEGIHKITTREVAKRAKMNNAALNYHFGTKDNLIRQAMDVFIQTLGGTYALLAREDLPPEERLLSFLKKFAEVSIRYPGVPKSLIGQMMWAEESNPLLIASQRKGIEAFTNSLMQVTRIQDKQELSHLALQIMSAILYPILIHKQLPDLYGFDYGNAAERDAYIERLFHQYIGPTRP